MTSLLPQTLPGLKVGPGTSSTEGDARTLPQLPSPCIPTGPSGLQCQEPGEREKMHVRE